MISQLEQWAEELWILDNTTEKDLWILWNLARVGWGGGGAGCMCVGGGVGPSTAAGCTGLLPTSSWHKKGVAMFSRAQLE